jgi:sigma-B regulation protein RsbU (phosphoserine phosphatase)
VVTGLVVPCYDVGGDCFDYAANGDTIHPAIFDPIGHGIAVALLATTAISVYRNARRTGLGLADTYRSVDEWIRTTHPARSPPGSWPSSTPPPGRLSYLCAGHPPALLPRDGRLVRSLRTVIALPLGLGHLAKTEPVVIAEALQPGDQVLLCTDGIVEARSPSGETFGTERLADFVGRALADHLLAPESLRRLVHAALAHHSAELQDDGSVLLAEWRPAYQQAHPF